LETESGQLPYPTINIGYVKIAFCWAFYYLKYKYPFENALYDILYRGGDTDTNACIVGGLLGARDGVSNLNRKWVKAMIKAKYNDSKKHDG
jgi:ADP-ribosylglycohydrolase